ncbi:uncharacterized protein BXZ73DRAFT_101444 [Epithele typhae]|uniref:uncharacterized protein n=1 Tax=Epithele typhae TaxID=378194 RepID=UPI00200742D5|nr:uncharacterized protein BXZ73DRAFT_101444 [Epithele typhae]KAH9932068.1 hypothetical protein BXZ73DRAFT_101444 [Epithele typhae]
MADSPASALLPLFALLAVLIFALLAWCLLSSCLGRPIVASLADLWDFILLSARAAPGGAYVRRRQDRSEWEDDDLQLLELEYRGRSRM